MIDLTRPSKRKNCSPILSVYNALGIEMKRANIYGSVVRRASVSLYHEDFVMIGKNRV